MNYGKLLFILLFATLMTFSVYLVSKQNTNKIREQKAAAAQINLKIASDPSFQEFIGEISNGFPDDFPVYPSARLVGSVINNPPGKPESHYTVKWNTSPDTSVADLIFWYKKELETLGWKVEEPDVWIGISELVVQVENENFKGAIAAEDEGEYIEFVADLKNKK